MSEYGIPEHSKVAHRVMYKESKPTGFTLWRFRFGCAMIWRFGVIVAALPEGARLCKRCWKVKP